MEKKYIGTLNNIAQVGLDKFGDSYEVTDDLESAHAIIVRSAKMHDMKFSDNLIAVGRAGSGVNNIPIERCSENGIVVFNAPGANSNAVKELVIASLIMSARNMYEGITWANNLSGDVPAEVEKGKKQFKGSEIAGKTLGIIGLGAIGSKVAKAAHALGMNIVGNSKSISRNLDVPCKMYDDLSEMVKVCDYVTIHVPSRPDTVGMINKNLISCMKDGVILLNLARPDLIVEDDVIEAIESGKIRKFVSDLVSEKLINHSNIITTPHIGASTKEAEENCAVMAANELIDYIEHGNITNSVNFPAVSMDEEGTKLSILYKGCDAKTVLEGINIGELAEGKSKNGLGACIALVDEATAEDAAESLAKKDCVLRVRIVE